ncbi:MAG: hypothetical protein U1F68_19830 [Gammaproteobacteria bacterium]
MKHPHDFQPFDPLPSDAELVDFIRRGRQLQAQAVRNAAAALYRAIRRWLNLPLRFGSDDSTTLVA